MNDKYDIDIDAKRNDIFKTLDVVEAEISTVDIESNGIWVKIIEPEFSTMQPLQAIPLSLTPVDPIMGSGIRSTPKVGDRCYVAVITTKGDADFPFLGSKKALILGYALPPTVLGGLSGGIKAQVPTAEGDQIFVGRGLNWIKLAASGVTTFFNNAWTKFRLDGPKRQLWGMFRNILLEAYGGKIIWEALDEDEDEARLTLIVNKKYQSPVTSDENREEAESIISSRPQDQEDYIDKIIFKAGTLENGNHLLELETRQAGDDVKEPDVITNHKLGKQDNGVVAEHVFSERSTGNEVKITINKNGDTTVSSNNPETGNVCELVFTPSSDGNIKIHSSAGNIILGGTGKEQQLVTKAFLDMFFANHIHGTAMGPSTPPTIPVTPASADSPSNPTTFTTKAE